MSTKVQPDDIVKRWQVRLFALIRVNHITSDEVALLTASCVGCVKNVKMKYY